MGAFPGEYLLVTFSYRAQWPEFSSNRSVTTSSSAKRDRNLDVRALLPTEDCGNCGARYRTHANGEEDEDKWENNLKIGRVIGEGVPCLKRVVCDGHQESPALRVSARQARGRVGRTPCAEVGIRKSWTRTSKQQHLPSPNVMAQCTSMMSLVLGIRTLYVPLCSTTVH